MYCAVLHRLKHRQLEAFRAVLQSGKVTAAAGVLNTTQPSISRSIADLEDVTGFKLFYRHGRQLVPTSEALALYEEVERSFVGMAEISRVIEDIRDYRQGSLLIAGLPALALHLLPAAIAKFVLEEPGISVSLRTRSSPAVMRHLSSQQFDLGFAEHTGEHPAVQVKSHWTVSMLAILPHGHALCEKETLGPADFHEQPFVVHGAEDPTRLDVEQFFVSAKSRPRVVAEAQLSAAICEMVANGAGISIVEPVTATYFAASGKLVIRPIEPALKFSYDLLLPALREPSRPATRFLQFVQEQFDALKLDVHNT